LGYVIDDFLSKEYIAQNIIDKIKIKDEELKDYYEKNISRFTSPEQVKARHILIKVPFGASLEDKAKARDKIKNILEWLKKGEKFETLAEQYSEDITSNKKGGELGYFQRGRMPKAFDDMAFSMKPGQISDVVETDYGYHIIEVQDKREAKTKTFEEVKDSIRQQLTEEITRKKIDEFIQKIEKDSGFKVYTERLIEKR
jgi:peptidyl-prolyl cis-trans isomerase C